MTSITDKLDSVWTSISGMPSDDIISFVLLVVAGLTIHEWALVHYISGFFTIKDTWADNQGVGSGLDALYAA